MNVMWHLMTVLSMQPALIMTDHSRVLAMKAAQETERTAQILMNVQIIEMIAMQMPHVLM